MSAMIVAWMWLVHFAVFVIALKFLVGKFSDEITWWIAFVMAAILTVISMLFGMFLSPLVAGIG